MLKRLLSTLTAGPAKASAPEGERIYAIGDVHGRADLLADLLRQIDEDHSARPRARRTIVFLGDLIDRGPESSTVVETVRRMALSDGGVHWLKGNHEEMFLQALDGSVQTMRLFAQNGGRETLLSYGVTDTEFDNGSFSELIELAAERVPAEHRSFLAQGAASLTLGDYFFVHAGVRPGVAFAQQSEKDMRWIRDEFLGFEGELEKVVVHGHSIAMEVQQHPHRIGIDTGAYKTGVLTALVLDGMDRRFLQVRGGPWR
jgi:serine/threonine protein phosphatase 1